MVKEKPNSVRCYDKDGFRQRAACLCFKNAQESELLLVSGSRRPDMWVVPGGGLEPAEAAFQAARREVMEEAGARGRIDRSLGIFENSDKKTRTVVYVMHVSELIEDWADRVELGRRRQWFSVSEARKQLAKHKPVQCSYVDLLP